MKVINMMNKQNDFQGLHILSLFDGLSAARISLSKADIPVASYYSSEICKNALRLQK